MKSEVFWADEELNKHIEMKRSHPTFVVIKQEKKTPSLINFDFAKEVLPSASC